LIISCIYILPSIKKNSNTFLFLSLLIGLVVLFGLVLSYILWSKLISLIKIHLYFCPNSRIDDWRKQRISRQEPLLLPLLSHSSFACCTKCSSLFLLNRYILHFHLLLFVLTSNKHLSYSLFFQNLFYSLNLMLGRFNGCRVFSSSSSIRCRNRKRN
jgi:hypothetical protein